MTPLAWVTALVVVGLAAIVLEVFVPSGGVLGFLSVVALVSGVGLAFIEQGPWFGMAVLAVVCMAVPSVLAAALRIFPETPLGRRVLPPPPSADEVVPDADRRAVLRSLVGRRGIATTELVPWGVVVIDDASHQAVSEGGPIASAAVVEVVGVQAGAVVVRTAAPVPSSRPSPGPEATPVAPDLEASLEAFDFEALDRASDGGRSGTVGELDSPPTRNNP